MICKYHTKDITVHNVFNINIVFSLEKYGTKLQRLCVNLQIPICCMLVCNFWKFIMDTVREIRAALKNHAL